MSRRESFLCVIADESMPTLVDYELFVPKADEQGCGSDRQWLMAERGPVEA
jgi:hypothetical protein